MDVERTLHVLLDDIVACHRDIFIDAAIALVCPVTLSLGENNNIKQLELHFEGNTIMVTLFSKASLRRPPVSCES
jgi:hypothetical protein